MGYSTRNNGQIKDFWPDNTETTLYISSEFGAGSLQALLDEAEIAWGPIPPCDIQISSEHVHTHCLGYDCYDSGDYTDFIVLTRKASTPPAAPG